MSIKFSLLLVFSLCLVLSSQCYEQEEESAEEELFHCFVRCDRKLNEDRELTECQRRCVAEYQERKEQERREREHGRGGRGFPRVEELKKSYKEEEEESAEEELFNCFVKCDRKRGNDHELDQCQQVCVKDYQERKERERQEGEHGRGLENMWNEVQAEAKGLFRQRKFLKMMTV